MQTNEFSSFYPLIQWTFVHMIWTMYNTWSLKILIQKINPYLFSGTEMIMSVIRGKRDSGIVKEDYSKGQGRENYSERGPDGKLLTLVMHAINDLCVCWNAELRLFQKICGLCAWKYGNWNSPGSPTRVSQLQESLPTMETFISLPNITGQHLYKSLGGEKRRYKIECLTYWLYELFQLKCQEWIIQVSLPQ